jgi:hypothetical protein
MKQPTYQDFLADPAVVLVPIEQAARRARAVAVHNLIVVPLMKLMKRAASKPAPVLQTRSA